MPAKCEASSYALNGICLSYPAFPVASPFTTHPLPPFLRLDDLGFAIRFQEVIPPPHTHTYTGPSRKFAFFSSDFVSFIHIECIFLGSFNLEFSVSIRIDIGHCLDPRLCHSEQQSFLKCVHEQTCK